MPRQGKVRHVRTAVKNVLKIKANYFKTIKPNSFKAVHHTDKQGQS